MSKRPVGYLTLSDYARIRHIGYQGAWKRYKAGKIPSAIKHDGEILVSKEEFADFELAAEPKESPDPNKVCVYARVSDPKQKEALDRQAQRCVDWAVLNGYQVVRVVKEYGSGLNDNRKRLESVLRDRSFGTLIVEHKDRLSRYGFRHIKLLLELTGREVLVINEAQDDVTDLVNDLVSVIYSFSARLYGKRRSERAKAAIAALEAEGVADPDGDGE